MTDKERYEKAVRLCEGGAVEINGLLVKAALVDDNEEACLVCDMDCLCRLEMLELCAEADGYDRKRHRLYLVNP